MSKKFKFDDDIVAHHVRGISANVNGYEIPDPTPHESTVGFERPVPLAVEIARMVRSEQLRDEMNRQGFDTFEEAEDFDCPEDDSDMSSPWEENFDPNHDMVRHQELLAGYVQEPDYNKAKEIVKAYESQKAKAAEKQPSNPAEEKKAQ